MAKPMTPEKTITAVCGFTRCGTSLVMRMLHAGGLPVFCDPDMRLSCETQLTQGLPDDSAWIDRCEGKVFKLLEPLHTPPPPGRRYRFILMQRHPGEQAKSMIKFMRAIGFPAHKSHARELAQSLIRDYPTMYALLHKLSEGRLLQCAFEDVLLQPTVEAARISEFIGGLNVEAMVKQVVKRSPQCYPGMMELQQIEQEEQLQVPCP
jgi:hypothetical protein